MWHIFDLGEDVLLGISEYLSALSIVYFFSSSKRLWQLRSKCPHYEQKISLYQDLIRTQNWDGGLTFASHRGDFQEVLFFIRKGSCDWNWGMSCAAEGGHKNLVEFFIDQGADDWNWAMKQAVGGKQPLLVNFLIEKGADNWNQAMKRAIENEDKEMVEFFIDKGADDWVMGLEQSVKKGNLELVEIFDYYAEENTIDWKQLMTSAVGSGSSEVFEYCLEKIDKPDLDQLLLDATVSGHKNIVDILLSKGATNIDFAMATAATNGYRELVERFIELGASDWVSAIQEAVVGGHLELIHFLDNYVNDAVRSSIDWNVLMCASVKTGNKWIVQYCISKGANHWLSGLITSMSMGNEALCELFASYASVQDLNEALRLAADGTGTTAIMDILLAHGANNLAPPMTVAAHGGHMHIIKYLIEHGATQWEAGLVGAVMSNRMHLINFFLQKGAPLDVGLCAAAMHGNRNLANYFVEKGCYEWKEGLFAAAIGMQTNMIQYFLIKGISEQDILACMDKLRETGYPHSAELVAQCWTNQNNATAQPFLAELLEKMENM